jgi:hypothetical protein
MKNFRIFRPSYSAITLINKPKIKTETLSYWTLKILVPSVISSYFTYISFFKSLITKSTIHWPTLFGSILTHKPIQQPLIFISILML